MAPLPASLNSWPWNRSITDRLITIISFLYSCIWTENVCLLLRIVIQYGKPASKLLHQKHCCQLRAFNICWFLCFSRCFSFSLTFVMHLWSIGSLSNGRTINFWYDMIWYVVYVNPCWRPSWGRLFFLHQSCRSVRSLLNWIICPVALAHNTWPVLPVTRFSRPIGLFLIPGAGKFWLLQVLGRFTV